MNNDHHELGFTTAMGPHLRAEVERQLIDDLKHYGVANGQLSLDWTDTIPEGHVTHYLDGALENWSGVVVRDTDGRCVAEGWLDFIHGGNDNPLYVFWDFLTIFEDGQPQELKRLPGIPLHIWDKLSESSRDLCASIDKYDSQWANDPLVRQWIQTRRA